MSISVEQYTRMISRLLLITKNYQRGRYVSIPAYSDAPVCQMMPQYPLLQK